MAKKLAKKRNSALSIVLVMMPHLTSPATYPELDAFVVRGPQLTDIMTGALQSAFKNKCEVGTDWVRMLAQIDAAESALSCEGRETPL